MEEIRVRLARLSESVQTQVLTSEPAKTQESSGAKKVKLQVSIEAIHEIITKNKIFYGAERLRGDASFVKNGKVMPTGQYSWTRPYNKPMLINHNRYAKPLGRAIDAQYLDKTQAGIPGIEVLVELTDAEAIEMTQDSRYLTVSIGADTDALYCSICNSNILDPNSSCNHWKGEIYDGKECYFSVGNLWFNELSFVNMPADENARVIFHKQVPTKESKEGTDEIFVLDDNTKKLRLVSVSEETQESNPGEEENNLDNIDATNKDQVIEGNQETPEDNNDQKETIVESGEENLEIKKVKEHYDSVLKSIKELLISEGVIENSDPANEEIASASESEMQEKLSSLEAELSKLKEDNNALINKNIELQKLVRDSIIEKIIEAKISLGYVDESQVEEETEAYQTRSEESLKDTLADLNKLLEKNNKGEPRTKIVVENPSFVDNDQNGVVQSEDEEDQKQTKKELSAEEVLKNLFSGKKSL